MQGQRAKSLLCRLIQAAAGAVAAALLQQDRGQDHAAAAECIAWAVDDGYTRCIVAKGLALQRAQAQLASSSFSESIPDLSGMMGPPPGLSHLL